MPKRIQMTRQRPWRHEYPDAVIVARPSKWGNPFAAQIPHGEALQPAETRAHLVAMYRRWITSGERFDEIADAMPLVDRHGRVWKMHSRHTTRPTPREIRDELAGRDLACWCPLDLPCHGDVLLELANGAAP
ncbi:DUF4326 domain-containing protein [Ruania suaedae]|uniref:DUF4326 domain-containing protein n=1 Tax=Ruania suaedae TaxID=2897774 RepID=UPI001E49B419|nr:DUF4326 domain-containing protein [Ruania suaedae]UFU03466.1 DUF4326 domain-containing protein [Ruania suaedae]